MRWIRPTLAVLAIAVVMVTAGWLYPAVEPYPFDLRIYVEATRGAFTGTSLYDYYTTGDGPGIYPFLYPPFAAALMAPLLWAPLGALSTAWRVATSLGVLVLVIAMTDGSRERVGMQRLVVMTFLALLTAISLPVMLGGHPGTGECIHRPAGGCRHVAAA